MCIFIMTYIAICIGSFIRCKSCGIASSTIFCILLATPPILFSTIFIFPIVVFRVRTIKDYIKSVSIMSRLAPVTVVLVGLTAQIVIDKTLAVI